MGVQDVRAFFQTVEQDTALQAKLRDAAGENEKRAIAQVVSIASDAGFRFSAAELADVREEQKKQSEELSPAQLEGVAGGRIAIKNCCYYAKTGMPGFY